MGVAEVAEHPPLTSRAVGACFVLVVELLDEDGNEVVLEWSAESECLSSAALSPESLSLVPIDT